MPRPSRAVESLPRSGIREIMELAWSAGGGVIHLEVGEPDFPTPPHVVEAAHRAASDGFTRYTPNAGIPELREALAEKVQERNSIAAPPDRIVVTPGAVAGIYSAVAAAADPGAEVLISDPCWPNYILMMELLGIRPVRFPLSADNGFIPDPALIEPHITDRTQAILLNSPANPTGACTPRRAWEELLELARSHDLWVLSDEVYDEIWFDEPTASAGPLDRDERVVSFFSFSKTYAMTGWRVGYMVTPPGLTESVITAQEPITSCVNAPAQKAAVAALTGPPGRSGGDAQLLPGAQRSGMRSAGSGRHSLRAAVRGFLSDGGRERQRAGRPGLCPPPGVGTRGGGGPRRRLRPRRRRLRPHLPGLRRRSPTRRGDPPSRSRQHLGRRPGAVNRLLPSIQPNLCPELSTTSAGSAAGAR